MIILNDGNKKKNIEIMLIKHNNKKTTQRKNVVKL